MSVEEMIAELESQKLACIGTFDRAIGHLRSEQHPVAADAPRPKDAPPIRPGSRFRPIPSAGIPASELILLDRG